MRYSCLECEAWFEATSVLGFVRPPASWYVAAEENYLGGGGILEFLCSDRCLIKRDAAEQASIAEHEEWLKNQADRHRQALLSRAERVAEARDNGYAILSCRRCGVEESKGCPPIPGQDDSSWTCEDCAR